MAAYLEVPALSLKVEVSSVSWSASLRTGGTSGSETGSLRHSEIVVTRPVDKHSLVFAREAYHGSATRMIIYMTDMVENTVRTYLTIKLDDCVISSYSVSGSGGQQMEQISLNFTKADSNFDPIKKP